MKKFVWIALVVVVLIIIIISRNNSLNSQRKEKVLKEVTVAAVEKYGYTPERYKFELKEPNDVPSILKVKITSLQNNKSWDVDYYLKFKSNGEGEFSDSAAADIDKMQSDIRIFLDSLRTHGFFPEIEKIKLRETIKDFNIKYPKMKEINAPLAKLL